MPTTATTPSRTAHLADSDREKYDHIVHGVAHGEDELTRGLKGPKYWPAAELETAAPTLEGQAVYKIHGDGDREEIGAVLRSAYEPGLGVVYEAGLNDAGIAEELSSGQREVSIEAGNPRDVDQHAETGAAIMRDYEYTGLATPKSGASQANYTAPGRADGNPAVAALSAGALEGVLDGDVDVEAALNSYRSAGGVRFRGTRSGKLDRSALPSDGFEQYFLVDRDTKSASSYPVVDSDGYLRRGNVAAAYSVGPRGGISREELYEKLRALNDAFRTPPIDPEKLAVDEEAEMAALASDLQAGAFLEARQEIAGTDDPTGARSPGSDDGTPGSSTDSGQQAGSDADATPDGGSTSMTDGNDPDHDVEALLERIDDKDETISSLELALEEKKAGLEEKDEQIEDVKEAYAAALATDDTMLDEEDFVERFTVAELAEKVEEREDAALADPDPDVQSGGDGGGDDDHTALLEGLSDDEQTELKAAKERYEHWEGKNDTVAAAEAEQIAELAGADDFDEVDLEEI